MWGHLSGIIQLVGELECKPGEILGLLFTVQPSPRVPGKERRFHHFPVVGSVFLYAELPFEDPGWEWRKLC